MFVVISYDISNNKKRNQVLNELKDYGHRVQFSVFECDLDQKTINTLRSRLSKLISSKKDSIRYYFLCNSCVAKLKVDRKRQ